MCSNRFWLALGMVAELGLLSVVGTPAIAGVPASKPGNPSAITTGTSTGTSKTIPPDAQASFAKADQQMAVSDFTGAMAILDALVKRYPNLAEAYTERAKLYVMLGSRGGRATLVGSTHWAVYDSYALENLNRAIALRPDYVEAYVRRGYFQMENYYDAENALIDFNRAAQLDPAGKIFEDSRYALRAKAHMQLGNWQAAKTDYDRATKANYRGEFDRGVAAVLAGDLATGIRDFDQVISRYATKPKDETGTDQLIVLHWRSMAKALGKDYNGALGDLNQALAAVPPNDDSQKAELLRDRGLVKWLQGKPQDALKDLNQVVEIGEQNPLIFLEYGNEVTQYLRAVIYTELGDRTQAAAITQDLSTGRYPLQKAEEKYAYFSQVQAKLIAPLLAKPIHPEPAVSRLLQAVLSNAMHDRSAALTAYKEAIRLAPNEVAIYTWAEQSGIFGIDPDGPAIAVANFTQLIRLQPQQAKWYRLRASYAAARGDYKTAIADQTWIIQAESTPAAYGDRGKLKLKTGDYQGAIADVDNAIKLASQMSLITAMPELYLSRAEAHLELKNYRQALADLENLFKANDAAGVDSASLPTNEPAILLRARTKLAMGDAKGAIAEFTKFKSETLLGHYLAHNGIGLAKLKLGDKTGAAVEFEQALYANAQPHDAESFYGRAVSLRYLGDKSGAIAHYQKAADLYQQSSQTAQQQKVLAEMQTL